MSQNSKISPAIFVLCILSFFFTFVTVSCQGHDIASFTGIQLATGTTVDQPLMFGASQKQKIDPEPCAVLALLCAVVGVGASFAGARTAIVPAISGAVGALSLLIMKSRLDGEIVTRGEGMFQVSYGGGFSLALLLMIAGVAWNGYLFSQRGKAAVPSPTGGPPSPYAGQNSNLVQPKQEPAPAVASQSQAIPQATQTDSAPHAQPPAAGLANARAGKVVCPSCGASTGASDKFCSDCGKATRG
jgi:hypothetical protein